MSTVTASPMFNQFSKPRSIPNFTAMTGNSKKSSNNSNNSHWSSAHTSDMTWPDSEATPLNGQQHSSGLYSGRISSNPWNNRSGGGDQPHNNTTNWNNSQEEIEPSSDKLSSELEELEISDEGGQPLNNEGHQRLRNSDSDAMKDGVPTSTQVMEDPLESGTEGGLWRGHVSRSSMGSTSSINSAGSSSSWKGGSNNGGRSSSTGNYQRSGSPRKHSGKYDGNRTMSTSSGGKPATKHMVKPKKHVMDIDEALDSLQGEPSGWGNLPSPKPTDVDTGTEVWGIPEDIKQKMKKEASTRNGWNDSNHTDDWAASIPSNRVTTPSGWGGDKAGGKSLGNQWGNTPSDPSSWAPAATPSAPGYLYKSNEKGVGFNENVKLLVDMGFSIPDSENALKRNNNNFESTLGDLLALASVKEDDIVVPSDLSPSNFPLPGVGMSRGMMPPNARLSPSGGISPRTTSPSFTHFTKDLSSLHVSASTPATPTLSASSTHNHLIQPGVGVAPPKLLRSNSLPQGDKTNINTRYVQKVLAQQLKDHHAMKQQLINQLKTPQSPKHQQMLTQRLNEINTNINKADQHLSLNNQLALQQKQHRSGPNNAIEGLKGVPELSSGSQPDVFSMADSTNDSTQPPTTTDSNSTTTNRPTVSKLQRIISSGGSQELMTPDVFQESSDMFDVTTQSTVTPIGGAPSLSDPDDIDTSSTLPSSKHPQAQTQTSLTGSGKFTRSVDDIPEFKPGVPWNPASGGIGNVGGASNRKYISQRSDTNRRPDSISLSSPYMETKSDTDYYPESVATHGYTNPTSHLSTQQYQRRGGTSPSNTPRGGYNTGYPSSGGFGSSGSGYYSRGQSSGGQTGYQAPRPSPSTPSYPSTPQYGSTSMGSRNQRQRLYSQQSTGGGGYTEGGVAPSQQRRGFDSGRKWSFDGSNPWGVPEKSGSSIWSVDSSNESILSPSIETEQSGAVFSPAMEWRAPIRKPSLPVNLSAPTNCILLKNVSPQVDELSIREVCSEFGFVQNCTINTLTGSALVFYQSKEDALQAKLGLEKNPIICGISVQPMFATEKTISAINAQRTPGHAPYHPSVSHVPDPAPWNESLISPSTQRIGSIGSNRFVSTIPPGGRHNDHMKKTAWGDQFTAAPGGPTPSATTPSSSVWNSGGILPGISNTWSGNTQSTVTPPIDNTAADIDSVTGTSPSMATFLPNGLF